MGGRDGEGSSLDASKVRSKCAKGEDDERSTTDAADTGALRAEIALDELDPMTRHLRSPMAFGAAVAASATAQPADPARDAARVSLEQLMSRFVRRVAWSGDGHAGSATIELGAGELEGATLTLHARGGEVQVSLDLPPGVDSASWKERIGQRLSARGLHVSSLEVT